MSYDLAGKKVLVTGASAGIGAALAEGFARRGAVVGICARRADRLADVCARLHAVSPESRWWAIDLADLDALPAFARRVEDELGGVDVLVNNAGIPKRRTVFALTPDVIDTVTKVNYLSPVHLTMALLPGIVERAGRIVYVSSVAARLSPPGEAAYAASKSALSTWAECLHVDLRDTGVKVHVVNPGVIDTELFHLPDNDPFDADVEALPVSAIVEPVLTLVEQDGFEVYVPDWFGGIVAGKFQDLQRFLDGTIEYARTR